MVSAILADFLEQPVQSAEFRHVAMGKQSFVQLPEHVSLILDCLPFAIRTYREEAKLSTIRWFRIASKPPETVGTETEIVNTCGCTVASTILLECNKERLCIEELTVSSGAQVGTEAAYKCQVCTNVPPEPLSCASAVMNVEGKWNNCQICHTLTCV